MLKQKLKEELKQCMLNKNTEATSVLRMLISAIGYFEIQKGGAGYEATDEDVLAVITKEVKQRKDSIEQYKNANRLDLVEKETAEMNLLTKYLPEQMSEEEIREHIIKAVQEIKPSGLSEIGKIMSQVMPILKGKADGSIINKIVREELEK